MRQGLELNQSQSLVMTPQLRQAIELLQMTNLELGVLVEQERESNPLLDLAESDDRAADGNQKEQGETGADEGGDAINLDGDAYEALVKPGETDSALDADYSNQYEAETGDYQLGKGSVPERGAVDPDRAFGENLAKSESLRDHLAAQMPLALSDPGDRVIAAWLIEGLDENGWLVTSPKMVANGLGVKEPHVLAVLERLQDLDPPGVFARDLAECLRLQLKDRDELDDEMALLLDHLHLIDGRVRDLAQVMKTDHQSLAKLVKRLRELDPRPGLQFDHVPAETLIPDVLMVRTPTGYDVVLNPETLPRVFLNNDYYDSLAQGAGGETKKYLRASYHSANWLLRAIHQRNQTILRVSREIIRHQRPFFDKGVLHLKPLVLREIAAATNLHESTISRATANKSMATPRGILDFRYFFGSSVLSGAETDQVSSTVVRHRIQQLVESEAPDAILSDDQIVQTLAEDGVFLARRTVAKYRDLMKIPSSIERRRRKLAQAPLA